MSQKKCEANAKITLPWGGKLLNYCPVHANQLVTLGNAMGSNISAQLLPTSILMECENIHELTEEEWEFNENFNPFLLAK